MHTQWILSPSPSEGLGTRLDKVMTFTVVDLGGFWRFQQNPPFGLHLVLRGRLNGTPLSGYRI